MKELQKALDFLSQVEGKGDQVPEKAIYAEGSNNAPICFIGEAPGEEEEMASRPFVGEAGRNLNRLLHSVGLSRSDCRIENVLQFRPYKNDISPYIKYTKKGGVKTSSIFDQSCVHLKERLEKTSANVLIPLGNSALYALTGKWGITKWRGSIIGSSLLEGRKVIPTIHPAAAIGYGRNFIYNYFIAYDMMRISREMKTKDIKLMDRTFYLSPSFSEVMSYINYCHDFPMIAFDIECTEDNPEVTHLSLATSPTNAICIPFFDGNEDYFPPDQEAKIWRALDRLLSNPKVVKVGHNIAFDATFVHRKYGICTRPIEDTMVGMGIAFPDFPKSLAFAVSIYCEGEPYYKDSFKKWRANPFKSVMEFRRYNAMDSAVVMEIFPKLINDIRRQGNFEAYIHQASIIEPLVYMQEKGTLFDVDKMQQLRIEAQAKADFQQVELEKEVDHPINPNSHLQVGSYFYDELKLKPYYKTNAEGEKVVTTDKPALQRLVGRGYKAAALILDIRHQRHLVNTYFSVILDSDNRMRCSYNPVGTVQGRISSSESIFGTGTNLLNQPPEMKKLMIPDPGYIMINIDLSQAENRCVAYQWNITKMIKAFEEGKDVHRLTAGLIFAKPPDQISDEKGSTEIGFGQYSERDIGKRSNHGFNYGLGSDTFAVKNQVSQADARRIRARYHAIYPEIEQGHRAILEELRAKGYLINMYGRKRYFKDKWGHKLFNKAYNFNAQSTVADHLNRNGFCALYYSRDSLAQKAQLLNQVYDSILFQYPMDAGPEALVHTLKVLCEKLEIKLTWKGRRFVIPIDISIGFNAYDTEKFTSKDVMNEGFAKEVKEKFYSV